MREGISVSDIVLSLAGHDSGKLFAVLKSDGQYAFLVDGKVRRLCNPKKKKLKHLERRSDSPLADKIGGGTIKDSEIRKVLAIARKANMTEEGNTAWQKTM